MNGQMDAMSRGLDIYVGSLAMKRSIDNMSERIAAIVHCPVSIYLHGSITLEDFKMGWSDIDILALTRVPLSIAQANELVGLRQTMLKEEPDNAYYRLFEGGILPLQSFLRGEDTTCVYWGTSGQRVEKKYALDVFSRMEWLDFGVLILGEEVRSHAVYPQREEMIKAVEKHYRTIRRYAQVTNESLYSAGWLLDIARCLYTLQTGRIIAKTAAGEWALENGLVPNEEAMRRAVRLRREPQRYKEDGETKAWLSTLGDEVQHFADVLEIRLKECGVTSA